MSSRRCSTRDSRPDADARVRLRGVCCDVTAPSWPAVFAGGGGSVCMESSHGQTRHRTGQAPL
eukprot:3932471-Rhodomonas_salina.2